ncbi:MAG: hypothetical protein RLZ98_1830 [Pseudomonadota bacterium]
MAALALAGLLASFATVAPSARTGSDIAGIARVIDGDTLEIQGIRVRLEGIDAPESDQNCGGLDRTWLCGIAATQLLEKLTARSEVHCVSHGTDRYRRMLGHCLANGVDLNAEMVRKGMAWAFVRYSATYIAVEASARAQQIGIWQGASQPAWEFRARRWHVAEAEAPKGCAIKGNISRNGHFYHLPWSPFYGRVKISPERGERWFCSEAEALAAGWLPAGVH